MATALTLLLRKMDADQRRRLAALSGTTPNYLYQIAGCHRGNRGIAAKLAIAISEATQVISTEGGGTLPVLSVETLAHMCALEGFEKVDDLI